MSVLDAGDVTPTQPPLEVGDAVSWRTRTGFRTGGTVTDLLEGGVVRVRTLAGAHDAFGVVTIAAARLTKENPL